MDIQYRKSDGTLGCFDSEKLCRVDVEGNTFTITLRTYGWDEYDFWEDEIKDVVEVRI